MSWIEHFEGLRSLEPALVDKLIRLSKLVELPEKTVIFGPGKAPDSLLLLLRGCVRVQQVSQKGREIVLYRVHAGQSCVLTTACVLAYQDYTAEGVAETDIEAVSIPTNVFDELVSESEDFRRFVFSAYSKRISELFMTIEEVAFERIDIRLAQKLIELSNGKSLVKTTHQNLATELGSAREVISRQLSAFQKHNWILQSRGTIEILDLNGLTTMART